ncbi:MAG: hypothetical protein FJ290_13360 [Planctomycetes bacterium]|nr:hypothetical protein [Planctomycetota bacterium]
MGRKKRRAIPPPPPESASDAVKAAYYEKHDPADLMDAGYFVEEDIFDGEERLATNPRFIAIIKRSRRHLRERGGIPAAEVRRRLSLRRQAPGK